MRITGRYSQICSSIISRGSWISRFFIDFAVFSTRLCATITLHSEVVRQKPEYVDLSTRNEFSKNGIDTSVGSSLPSQSARHLHDNFGSKEGALFGRCRAHREATLAVDFSKLRFFLHMGSVVASQS